MGTRGEKRNELGARRVSTTSKRGQSEEVQLRGVHELPAEWALDGALWSCDLPIEKRGDPSSIHYVYTECRMLSVRK